MAASAVVMKSPQITFNAVDYSAQCKELQFNISADAREKTASGDTDHVFMPGLLATSVTATFYMVRGASTLESNLWAALQAGTVANLVIKPKSGANAADNPQYTVSAFVQSMPFISGAVGAEETVQVTFGMAGAVTRVTT